MFVKVFCIEKHNVDEEKREYECTAQYFIKQDKKNPTCIKTELYLEKAFEKNNLCPKQRLPIAQQLGETSLMFLIHPTLTEEMMHAVGQIIQSVLQSASR